MRGFPVTPIRGGAPPSPRPMRCDVLVKIGGSILDDDESATRLASHLATLAGKYRFLILTGGGRAAKRIKANQRANHTHFHECWKGGVYCLEVNASLLASYSTSFSVVGSLTELSAAFDAGRIPVLAPAGAIISSLHLTPDWEVTTDSMGLYFAALVGARRYVVVSDVHGIYASLPEHENAAAPIPRLNADQLNGLPSSKLDPSFVEYFRRYALPTVVVNGRYPSRVSAAISGLPTVCTEIVCDSAKEIA